MPTHNVSRVFKAFFTPKRKGFLAAFAILLILSAWQSRVVPEPIVLKTEVLPFTPKEYYIADVVDVRKNKSSIGFQLPLNATPSTKPQPIDLKGGGSAAIKQFVLKGLPQNKKLRPVVVRLNDVKVTETFLPNGRVEGRVSVDMTFDLQRNGEAVKLTGYKSNARYERSTNHPDVLEPVLRGALTSSLKYLNTWMDKEANNHPKLAKSLKVTFVEPSAKVKQDTVFYHPSRPLNWGDFKAQPTSGSRYAAAVFPTFGYESNFNVVNGVLEIKLEVQVFVVQSSSWVMGTAKTPYTLNHEQRHFDIAKIVSERFKQKMKPEKLTLEDYNSIIQYEFLESYKEMHKMQELYDGETHHGTNTAMQEKWNQRIDTELRALLVKK